MGACARNMQSDPAEIKPAQCCIKLVFSFDLYYDTRKQKIKIYFNRFKTAFPNSLRHILTLFFHPTLSLSSRLFPSGSPVKMLCCFTYYTWYLGRFSCIWRIVVILILLFINFYYCILFTSAVKNVFVIKSLYRIRDFACLEALLFLQF